MNAPLLFSLLITPALPLLAESGIDTTWLPDAKEQSRTRAEETQRMMDIAHTTLAEFQAEELLQAPITTRQMPPAVPGKLVAVSDGGLIFDSEQSQLIYIRNVRVNDARLRLRASDQLIIQLEKKATRNARKKAPESVQSQTGRQTTPTNTSADAQSAAPTPAAGNSPAPSENQPPNSPPADSQPPVPEISAPVAILDMETNRILLSTAGHGGTIRINRGEDFFQIDTPSGGQADILADEDGNLSINGTSLHITWRDREGQLAELRSPAARIYYHAATQSIVLEGACTITHPQGSASCQEGLCAILATSEPPATPRTGFMSQFTNIRPCGIRAATARGKVHLHTPAWDEHPESDLKADFLSYNGTTGACLLTGQDCHLHYGENHLHTTESIRLKENGDIIVIGSNIDGTYTRPSRTKPEQILRGTFSARDKLTLTAADGIARTENGLSASDAQASFTCTGPAELHLTQDREPTPIPARENVGMLNLAVMQYTTVKRIRAWQEVRVRFQGELPGQQGQQTGSAIGDYLEADTRAATIRVDALAGHPAILTFGRNEIRAQSPESTARIELLPNGDLDVQGRDIRTTLQSEQGTTQTFCHDSMHLDRAQGLVTTGPGADVHSPSGLFTANGPLTITLAPPADGKATAPLSPEHPQLTYPFGGVSRITTAEGGTLRTTRASLQCSGPVDIELDPTATGEGQNSIKRATASGQVAILGKDQQGRLLRATGDHLVVDAASGTKVITGRRVTLSNEHNTHTASGPGAAVRVDRHNNARITGARQVTTATAIQQQVENHQQSPK